MRKFWMLIKVLTAFRDLRVRNTHQPTTMSVACCNPALVCCTSATTNDPIHDIFNYSASAGSFFFPPAKNSILVPVKDFLNTKQQRTGNGKQAVSGKVQESEKHFFGLLAAGNAGAMVVPMNINQRKIRHSPFGIADSKALLVVRINRIIKFLRHNGIFIIALLPTNLFFTQKNFGQTATVTFDYTGATFTCGADNTYTSSSTSLTVPATGIPAGATITGISFQASYGVAFGTTNITFILNGTSIGGFSATTATCVTGTISSVSIPLFNKTGPNTLAVTISGGTFPEVSNGVFAETYTNCLAITASATKNDVSCFNANSGTIVVTGSGGTVPYTFSINNGTNYQASNTFNNLPAGTYQIRVNDTNGCESRTVQ